MLSQNNGFGASSLNSTSSMERHEDESVIVSDCESFVSGARGFIQRRMFDFDQGFVKLEEGDVIHDLIKRRFLRGLLGTKMMIEDLKIHRNACSSVVAQARLLSFQLHAGAVAKFREGNANVKYGWYGTCGDGEIKDIVTHGFGYSHGYRLCLSSDDSPLESVKRCGVDKDGVRHLLLCRVILGRCELVNPDSDQCKPSSEEYDSGVDSFSDPKKYIIWSNQMNTHVLPAYVLSFKASSCFKGIVKSEEPLRLRPSSPWIPFPTLISVLSKVLPSSDIAMITKFLKYHIEKKVSRNELIQKVRQIAGDKLLMTVIKSYRAKKKSASFLQTRSKKLNRTAINANVSGIDNKRN